MNARAYAFPALLIAGGVGLIQYHSIIFWTHATGPVGWAWSLCIESAGLWLWYRPGLPSRMLGVVASILLLAGPLYQIASPAIASRAAAQASAQASAHAAGRLRNELAQDAHLLRMYAQNSQKRTGWLPAIQGLQMRMDADRARLDAFGVDRAKSVVNTALGVDALVLLQALGLLLIQLTNILAITHLTSLRMGRAQDAHPAQDLRNPEPEGIEEEAVDASPRIHAHDEHARLRDLAARVRNHIESEDMSIARASERLGVDRRDLGYLLSWSKPGDRKPPATTLDVIEGAVA